MTPDNAIRPDKAGIPHTVSSEPFDPHSVEQLSPEQERYFLASQWKMMWWRFLRHRLAVVSGIFLLLLYLANVYLGISIGGLMDPQYTDQPWSWGKLHSILQHLLIPTLVIGSSGTAAMIRRLRANLLDELHKQYVVTGRAKGLPPGRLLLKYPLRMSLNPFIADIGSLLPELVSGAVIVSQVMSLPTTGPMLLQALRSQDMYLAGSFLMFLAMLTVIGVLLSDLALAALDPRIRLGGGATK